MILGNRRLRDRNQWLDQYKGKSQPSDFSKAYIEDRLAKYNELANQISELEKKIGSDNEQIKTIKAELEQEGLALDKEADKIEKTERQAKMAIGENYYEDSYYADLNEDDPERIKSYKFAITSVLKARDLHLSPDSKREIFRAVKETLKEKAEKALEKADSIKKEGSETLSTLREKEKNPKLEKLRNSIKLEERTINFLTLRKDKIEKWKKNPNDETEVEKNDQDGHLKKRLQERQKLIEVKENYERVHGIKNEKIGQDTFSFKKLLNKLSSGGLFAKWEKERQSYLKKCQEISKIDSEVESRLKEIDGYKEKAEKRIEAIKNNPEYQKITGEIEELHKQVHQKGEEEKQAMRGLNYGDYRKQMVFTEDDLKSSREVPQN